MVLTWCKWDKIINKAFVHLTKCTDRYLILYGSRGSGKSDYVSKQLIYNCLTHKYFKCILYRKNFNTISESSFETIKQNIIELGLTSLFDFRVSPLQIILGSLTIPRMISFSCIKTSSSLSQAPWVFQKKT